MVNFKSDYIKKFNIYIFNLSKFLDYVCEVISKSKKSDTIKAHVERFGCEFERLVKFIQENEILNQTIFSNEVDLRFALRSFGEAFHSNNYELCSEILKYEIKYIFFKWQQKVKDLEFGKSG